MLLNDKVRFVAGLVFATIAGLILVLLGVKVASVVFALTMVGAAAVMFGTMTKNRWR